MSSGFNRRDFLKFSVMFPVGVAASNLAKFFRARQSGKKNVIIVVFDAFTAHNMSLYGYARETTPNINKLADRAIVYHNHYAGSNFTSPGTASLLTGTLPWTHRAMQPNSRVVEKYFDKSIFNVFNDFHRMAYSHNEWVNTHFETFKKDIDEWIPRLQLCNQSLSDSVIENLFGNDRDISSVAWVRNAEISGGGGYAYPLYLSRIISYFEEKVYAKYLSRFPKGIPTSGTDNGFLLEDAIDWVGERLISLDEPIFGYFHFLPPHSPYRPPSEFFELFSKDGYTPPFKPRDIFADKKEHNTERLREYYDEFILYVDQQFGRFYEMLERSGVLNDTLLILTSDHGEAFERGVVGHDTSALYDPLLKVPLLIFEPGRNERMDIYEQTSALDLMPTLAYLSNKETPSWSEGEILPPFRESENSRRGVYAVRSYGAEANKNMQEGSVVLLRHPYKLHYYYGYSELNGSEKILLFNLETDPEEMKNLASLEPEITNNMLDELKDSLKKANSPYL